MLPQPKKIPPILQSVHYKYKEKSGVFIFYYEKYCGFIKKISNFEIDMMSHRYISMVGMK